MARIIWVVSLCSPRFPGNLIRDLPQLKWSKSCCTGLSWAELGLVPEPAPSSPEEVSPAAATVS